MRYLILFLFSITAFAALNEVDKQFLAAKNFLRNPGFENGKAGTSATGGSYTLITYDIPSNGISGKVTASWDPSAADQYLNLGTITYYRWSPVAQKNGIALCSFRSGYSEYTLEVYDGTNVIASQVLSTGGTTSLTKKEYVNFAFPTTTLDSAMTITVRLKSTADAVAVLVDDCFLGLADEVNLSAVKPVAYLNATSDTSQTSTTAAPKIYEDLVFSTNITYNTGTGVATIQIPGKYRINASTGCGTSVVGLAVYKNGSIALTGYYSTGNSGGRTGVDGFLDLVVGDTIDIRPSASTCASGTDGTLNFVNIELIDTAQGTAYRPDQVTFVWSGFHSNDCSFTRTSTSYGQLTGDSTCTFTEQTNSNMGTVTSTYFGGVSLSPGIGFYTPKAMTYHVCANVNYDADGNNTNWQMIEKTSGVTIVSGAYQQMTSGQFLNMQMCGVLPVNSVQQTAIEIQCKAASGACALTPNGTAGDKTVQWSIFGVSQQLPAPLLVNSVVSNSSGVEGIHRAFITNTGTPTISSGDQSGDWIDSITDGAAGVVKVNFKAGVFSRKPACTAMCVHNGTNCTVFAYNNTVEPSTTSIQLVTRNSAGTGVDEDIMLICMGPR